MQRPTQLSTALADSGWRAPWIALALVLAGQCLIVAHASLDAQSAFSEYLNQARRCVELADCPSRGGRTGGLPLFHGALWIRLLAYALRSGADLTLVQAMIFASWALSLPIVIALLHRHLGWRAAALGIGLYFPVVLVVTDIGFLTYTNLLPLPFAVYYYASARFVAARRVAWAVIASAALAMAVSAELGGIVMIPFHFLVIVLLAGRAVPAVLAAGLGLAVPFWLDSRDAALAIVQQMPTARFGVALAICGGLVALLLPVGRRLLRQPSQDDGARVRLFMMAALLYATGTVWLGNLLLNNGVPAPRYLVPASFPFLYLIAARLAALSSRRALALAAVESASLVAPLFAPRGLDLLQLLVALIVTLSAIGIAFGAAYRRSAALATGARPWPAVAICGCALLIAAGEVYLTRRRGADQAITMRVAERLIPALYEAGYTYPELLVSLQGPAADDLLALTTERDPDLFREPPPRLAEPRASLLVITAPDAVIDRTAGVLARVPVADHRSAVAVRGAPPFLAWHRARRCTRRAADRDFACAEPRRDQPLPRNWPFVTYGDPVPDPSIRAADPTSDALVRYEVPIHTPGAGVAHVVRTASEWPADWRIAAVRGVAAEGPLPGHEIRLLDAAPADGVLVLEYASPLTDRVPWVWLPHLAEVEEPNAGLLDALPPP